MLEQLEHATSDVPADGDDGGDGPDTTTGSSIGQALTALFSPPDDLNVRVLEGINARRLAASLALLTGLGDRQDASEIAAGRAWRNILAPGDHVATRVDGDIDIEGTVVSLHATAVEIDCAGRRLLVPHSQLLDAVVERTADED